jgi:hypothetical protein
MNPFIIPEIVELNTQIAPRHFPLRRASVLQNSFSRMLSRHIGGLQSGQRFETGSLLVTGLSGSGKSKEIGDLLHRFHESATLLPSGQTAKFAGCVLDSKGGWKGLGKATLRALGYPIDEKTRRTQSEIWDLVVAQAELRGFVGIHYDEAQHIMRGRGEGELLAILDSFKTLMKSHQWPLMLILSGVPELENYVRQEPQLFRLMSRVRFEEITLSTDTSGLADDYSVINEIIGSYAIDAGLGVSEDLRSIDFLHRLATAAAFRWGILIEMTLMALDVAKVGGAEKLTRAHFDRAWFNKTGMNEIVSPFSHPGYETMYRRDRPFEAVISN